MEYCIEIDPLPMANVHQNRNWNWNTEKQKQTTTGQLFSNSTRSERFSSNKMTYISIQTCRKKKVFICTSESHGPKRIMMMIMVRFLVCRIPKAYAEAFEQFDDDFQVKRLCEKHSCVWPQQIPPNKMPYKRSNKRTYIVKTRRHTSTNWWTKVHWN